MRFVGYLANGERHLGVLFPGEDGAVRDVTAVAGREIDLADAIRDWPDLAAPVKAAPSIGTISDLELIAPFWAPRRDIFCVGKNYRDHAAEFERSGVDQSVHNGDGPLRPIIFTKAASSVVGPGDDVVLNRSITTEVDYEAELLVIIGRDAKSVGAPDAMDYVWGYTLMNDVTARDLQRQHVQWFLGKSMDTFCPMGPAAVSAEAINGCDLQIECRVNGELRQSASTRNLIFSISELIEVISHVVTLRVGDLIATGTSAGVGIGFEPPRYLVDSDVVEVSAPGIGTLRNQVRQTESA